MFILVKGVNFFILFLNQTHIPNTFLCFLNSKTCYLNYDTKHIFFCFINNKTRFSTTFLKPQFSHLFKQQFLNSMTKQALRLLSLKFGVKLDFGPSKLIIKLGFDPIIYIYNNRWRRVKLKLKFLIRVLILCHISRFILLIFQFKSEIGVQFWTIFTMLTLGSPPFQEICFTFECCAFFFFWAK